MFMFLVLGSMIVIEFGTIMFKIAVVTLLISCVLLVAIQGYHFVYYYVFKKNKKTNLGGLLTLHCKHRVQTSVEAEISEL